MKSHIPNFITLLNLSCGFTAILLNDPFWSPILIFLGAVFDLLDGLFAKLLKVVSEFGKQLDSLADLVTFGLAPAYLYFQHVLPHHVFGYISASFLPVFGALRLARFNVKDSNSGHFKGLPIPANAIFFLSIPLLLELYELNWLTAIFQNQIIIYMLPVLFGLLMVSNIKMFSFKHFNKGLENNIVQIVFLVTIIGFFILFKWIILIFCIPLYILYSFIGFLAKLKF